MATRARYWIKEENHIVKQFVQWGETAEKYDEITRRIECRYVRFEYEPDDELSDDDISEKLDEMQTAKPFAGVEVPIIIKAERSKTGFNITVWGDYDASEDSAILWYHIGCDTKDFIQMIRYTMDVVVNDPRTFR